MLSLNGVNVLSQNGDNNATSTNSNYYNSNVLGNINNVLLNQNESITNNILPSFGALSLDSSNVRTLNQRVVVFNGESLDSLIEILENIYSKSKKIAAYKKVTYNSGDIIIVVGFYQKSKVNIIVNQILSIYCNRNSSILRVEYLYDERLAVKLNSLFEFEVLQEIYADIYFLIISNNASIDEKSTISQFAAQFGPIETFQIVCSSPWIYHCRYDSILSAFEAKKFSQVNIEGLQFITKPTIIEIVQLFKKEETQNIWNYVKLFNPQLLGNEQWKKFDILKNKRLATSLSLKNVPKENQINIEDINNGFDIRTTIMIRNIPNQMTYNELKTIIDKSCQKCYNFLCMYSLYFNRNLTTTNTLLTLIFNFSIKFTQI